MSAVVVVGSFVQDLAFMTKVFPQVGETRIGEFFTGPGGKGFNQAVACHRLGTQTLFIGAVGEDLFARTVREFAEKEVLPIALEVHPLLATGAASIVVNAGSQNLIVVALGANAALSSDFIEAQQSAIVRSRVTVGQLESSISATTRAFELAREGESLTVLNPAPINEECPEELFELVDIIVPNESEFEYLLRRSAGIEVSGDIAGYSNAELVDLCAKIPVPTVVLTRGEHGAFLCAENGEVCLRFPAANVRAIDTTGAGDSFTGALASGLVRFDRDITRAVRFAVSASGLSTERRGTAPAMPTIKELSTRFPW
jgi:ribokinase